MCVFWWLWTVAYSWSPSFCFSPPLHIAYNDEYLSYLKQVSSKYDFHYCYFIPDIIWYNKPQVWQMYCSQLNEWVSTRGYYCFVALPLLMFVFLTGNVWCEKAAADALLAVTHTVISTFFFIGGNTPSVDFLHQRLSEDYSFFFQFLSFFFNVALVSCKQHRLHLRLTACRNAAWQRVRGQHVVNRSLLFIYLFIYCFCSNLRT